MMLFQPKSKIKVSKDLAGRLDEANPDDIRGVSVYTHGVERKAETFADLVGDDVFFGEDTSEKAESGAARKLGNISEVVINCVVLLVAVVVLVAVAIVLKKFVF